MRLNKYVGVGCFVFLSSFFAPESQPHRWSPTTHYSPTYQQDAGASQAIRELMAAQQEAWNRGDIPAFLTGYWNSPDLTFSGSDGIVRGYGGLLARYQKSYPTKEAMGILDFSELEIRSLGPQAALVLGHWHLKRSNGDVGGVFTLIFQRFPEGWRIVHDHTSAQTKHR